MTTKTFIKEICSKSVWLNIGLMFLVGFAFVVLTGLGTALYTHHGEKISIPDIRNKKFADAEELLDDAGLRIEISDSGYNRQLPEGCVLQQQPLPGVIVKSGRVIYVTVNSADQPTLTLPDIIDNSSEREATAKLRILGFRLGPTQYITGEKGWVYGVICRNKRLVAGDKVPVDMMVTLQVGSGLEEVDNSIEDIDPFTEDAAGKDIQESPEEDPFQEIPEE